MRRQRGFVMLIVYAVLALLAAGTMYAAWSSFTGRYVAEGVAQQKVETDRVAKERDDVTSAFAAYRTTAEENAAKALAFIAQLKQQAADAVKQEVVRYVTRTRYIKERLAAVPALPSAVARVRFPAAAASVLDAIGLAATGGSDPAAIAGPTAAPAGDPAAAAKDATVGDVVEYCGGCTIKHEDLRQKLIGWNAFYDGLRGTRPAAAEAVGVIREPHMALFTVHPTTEDLQ